MDKRDAVIVAFGRSAYCKAFKGSFAKIHPVEYSAKVLKGVLAKVPQLKAEDIEDCVLGCALQEGVQAFNMAKVVLQRAELPDTIPAMTINRNCSAGLQSIALVSNAIRCGEYDVAIAGGIESMSLVNTGYPEEYWEGWLKEHRPGVYFPMGITAENVAEQFGITREEMDQAALESHQKAAKAREEGLFKEQIIPITVTMPDGSTKVVDTDEGIRPDTSLEKLASLKSPFKENGQVTAGTSSQMTDGCGFVVVMSKEKADELGVKPIARLTHFATAGVPAEIMGIGPTAAVPKLLKVSGMSLDDFDVIELNEAFASQFLASIKKLGLDKTKINPMGGAMSLGHPLGASGAMLVCKAITWLKHTGGKYALITMCIGGGQGGAGVLELL